MTSHERGREAECLTNPSASAEIYALATRHGLADSYADAPQSRFGEYTGTVNGITLTCRVYDRDPAMDLAALQAAIAEAYAPVVSEPVKHRAAPADREPDQSGVHHPIAGADVVASETTNFQPDTIDSGAIVEAPEQYSLGFGHPASIAPPGRKLLSKNGQVLSEAAP